MPEKELAWLILMTLVCALIGAYLLAWRGKNALPRRIGAWIVALVSALAGAVVLVGYAIPTLNDFHNSSISFSSAFLENIIVWAICVGAWIVAARFIRRAVRGA
jgi:cytochrome bd-type quinol oxidase subunit 2